ncbi:MAG: porin [Phycisphaerales bacterium]
MSQTKSMVMLAGAALSLGGVAVAEQSAAWTSQNADEVRAIVAEMLADSNTRSSLLQSGGTAGHDGKHFFLASQDGNFRLNVSGQIQFRYYVNFRDDPNQGVGPAGPFVDDFDPGFETRRTKLEFSGHVFEPNLFYKVRGAFDRTGGPRTGGAFGLEDAYVGYKWDNGFSAQWGQFKLPFLKEESISSARQLAVDRSLTNEVFNQDFSQAIQMAYTDEAFRAMFAFSDGLGSRNTSFGADPADYALTGRVEFMWAGDWKQYDEFTSQRGSPYFGAIGAAVHFEDSPDVKGTIAGNTESLLYTIDLMMKGDGWNLFGAFIGSHIETAPAAAPSFDDFAFVAQGGVYLADDFEIFGRWDAIIPDGDRTNGTAVARSGNDMFNTVTGGFNYYMHGHAAKFTLDVQWNLDNPNDTAFTSGFSGGQPGGVFGNPGGGIGFQNSGNEDNQFVVRAQFQLLF